MKDYPLSIFIEAAKTTLGGAVTFYMGMVYGSVIVFTQGISLPSRWEWYAVGWMLLLPYTIAKLWGLFLAPFLGIMLIGLLWKEWSRIISFSLIAIVFSIITLVSAKHNPFESKTSAIRFGVSMGIAVVLLFGGVYLERTRKVVQQGDGD